MTPEEIYLRYVVESILSVRGLKRGLPDGLDITPEMERLVARNLIRRFGHEPAFRGLIGAGRLDQQRVAGRFVSNVVSILREHRTIPDTDRALTVLTSSIGGALATWREEALRAAVVANRRIMAFVRGAHADGTQAAFAAAGMTFNVHIFDNSEKAILARLAGQRHVGKPLTVLFDSAFAGVDKGVDMWIRKMKGAPVHEASASLFQSLIGEKNMPAAEAIGYRGEEIRRAVIRVGSTKSRAPHMARRGLFSRIDRFVTSEMRAIEHHASAYMFAQGPMVQYVYWLLSPQHAQAWSSPDQCDVYAFADNHGVGAGLFRPENVPGPPHPFCQCTLAPGPILHPEESRRVKDTVPRPKIPSRNQVERILKAKATKKSPRLTPNRLRRMTTSVQNELRFADQYYRREGI